MYGLSNWGKVSEMRSSHYLFARETETNHVSLRPLRSCAFAVLTEIRAALQPPLALGVAHTH